MRSRSLRIELLSRFRVWVGEQPVADGAWHRRKPAALVKMLALAPGHRLQREQVMDALWPDLDPEAAGANLRKALYHARSALEDVVSGAGAVIRSDGDALALDTEGLSIDLELYSVPRTSVRPRTCRLATSRNRGRSPRWDR